MHNFIERIARGEEIAEANESRDIKAAELRALLTKFEEEAAADGATEAAYKAITRAYYLGLAEGASNE